MTSKDYYKCLLLNITFAIGYTSVVFILFSLFSNVIKSTSFQSNVLYNFDAEHYVEIRNNGYSTFNGTKGDERAFFPLFPLIWKYSKLSQIGISIFNFLIFCICQSFLFTELKLRPKNSLALMSFPSLMFMMLPYSESLFYVGSVLLCLGFIKDKVSLVVISFFLISMIRPVYSILLPAYILTLIFTEKNIKTIVKKSLLVTSSVIIGVFFVSLYQFIDTGEWFAFIKAQQGAPWFNVLQFPTLPFRSWSQFPAMPIDALSLVIGILCLIILFSELLNRLITNRLTVHKNIYLFSMFYVVGISLAVLLFRGGSFHSLNRFVFCTVYLQLVIIYFWKHYKRSSTELIYISILVLTIVWYFFNGFTHIRLILSYIGLSVYLGALVQCNNTKPLVRNLSLLFVLSSSSVVQVYFLYGFFTWTWIA